MMVVETSASGHRLVYVREIIAKALQLDMSVVLATADEVLTDPQFARHLGPLQGSFRMVTVQGRVSVRKLQYLASGAGCDLVLVPDTLKYGLSLLLGHTRRSPRVRLLIMNDPRWRLTGKSLFSLRTWLKLILFELSSARPAVEVLWLRPQGTAPSSNVVIDPLLLEVSIEQTQADSLRLRTTLGMDPSTFWFGVVGGLDSRKNIPMIIAALRNVALIATSPVGLALIGQWRNDASEDEATEALEGVPFCHVGHNVQLSNQEMNVAVAALDCVVMAYSTTAPNSTTAKAAALGVRVATAGSPTFRKFAERLTGCPGVDLEVGALTKELAEVITRDRPRPLVLSGPDGLTLPLLAPIPVNGRKAK